ncbi:MAG: hypothetical protein ACK5MI_08500 [Mangrovibacterium sp.]
MELVLLPSNKNLSNDFKVVSTPEEAIDYLAKKITNKLLLLMALQLTMPFWTEI